MSKPSVKSNVLPRVALLGKKKEVNVGNSTLLPCGERVAKNHKCLTACGSIEELIGLIGGVKARYFNIQDTDSQKIFIFARLTKIQEDLTGIIRSITTTVAIPGKHTSSRFPVEKIRELENTVKTLNVPKYNGIPGTSTIESELYSIWALTRRCERQITSVKDPQIGLIVEESVLVYMNILGDYFSMLINHISRRF